LTTQNNNSSKADRSLRRRRTADLLSDWSAIMSELRRRGAIRSENNPTGDLAEALVAGFYQVQPAANSTAGYDLYLSDGTRVQVKGRRCTAHSKPSHYGLMRRLDEDPFDLLVVVNLDEKFAVESAYRMPISVVRELARFSSHTNAWRLPVIRGSRADLPGVEQIELEPRS
jgi:hypothetical protein